MPRIPDDLPQWIRLPDFMIMRAIVILCLVRMLAS